MTVRAHPKGEPAPNKGEEYPAEVLTDDEFDALLGTCSMRAPTGIRDRAMLNLLARSGLRVGEIALDTKRASAAKKNKTKPPRLLYPHDLDFSRHSIRLGQTKSGKPQTRGWHQSADDSILRWVETRRALGISARAPLFCTLKGTPVSTQQVRNMVKRRADKAGITKRAHPHMLRHTFADQLRRKGADVVVICALLGHSSIAVIHRYLNHLGNYEAVEALQAISMHETGSGRPKPKPTQGAL